MLNLIIALAVLLVAPFLLAYIHGSFNKKVPAAVLYYRYFITFNVILSGIFVAVRMLAQGSDAIYYSYAIAIFSIIAMTLVTGYSRREIMLAPAICWIFFLIFSSVLHVHEILKTTVVDTTILYAHVGYNIIVAFILLAFVLSLRYVPLKAHSS
jgi:hypothetical protein